MAVGDVAAAHSSVANNASLTIQPAAGVEWVIHNLYYAGAVELYKTDGTNDILFDSDTEAGARLDYAWHVTNTIYLKLKNVSGASKYLGYDGVITK